MSAISAAWREVSLAEICEFRYGKSLPDAMRAGGDVPVFGSNGVVGQHNESITAGPAVVVGRKGSFGEVRFSPVPCWPIDTTYYIDNTATGADLKWLAYRLAGLGLKRLNKAAAVPGLNREDAYRQRLLLPPLPEQRRIAEVLDRAEALRAKRRDALAQLDVLTQSIFFDMFGDLRNCRCVPMESLACNKRHALSSGPFGSNLTSKHYVDKGVLVLRGLNVTGGEVALQDCRFVSESKSRELSRSIVVPGDIVIVAVGSSGLACLIPETVPMAVMSQNFNKISPNLGVVDAAYLCFVLNSELVQRQFGQNITDTVRTFLSLTKVKKVSVPLPPLSLQREFARRVAAVEKLKDTHRASLGELDALFSALQYRAFRGEL
ncbi:MAG: restriction endonuclease subunit S [Dehalococcoidia bacterium]|nr:restriction endonuclease subunit S [Dehalococcoidia bacterium]